MNEFFKLPPSYQGRHDKIGDSIDFYTEGLRVVKDKIRSKHGLGEANFIAWLIGMNSHVFNTLLDGLRKCVGTVHVAFKVRHQTDDFRISHDTWACVSSQLPTSLAYNPAHTVGVTYIENNLFELYIQRDFLHLAMSLSHDFHCLLRLRR
jgi:hypothetical protein